MNKSDFTIFTLCQDLTINPKDIVATSDSLNSFLRVPVKFLFRQPSKDLHFDIDTITANLLVGNTLISSTTEYTRFSINMSKPREEKEDSQVFQFILSQSAIEFIEKNRDGDANFRIEFRGSLKFITVFHFNRNGGVIDVRSLFQQQELRSDMYLSIPQSQWVKLILSGLNYNAFLLVEVPLNNKLLKEAYKNVAAEFKKAEEYFKDHKYYESIGACRKTMDELAKNLINYKKKLGSDSNYKWLEEINENTFKWIDSMNKTNSTITSKPHHAGDHSFLRHEAESVYLITLGLMNFVGHIK